MTGSDSESGDRRRDEGHKRMKRRRRQKGYNRALKAPLALIQQFIFNKLQKSTKLHAQHNEKHPDRRDDDGLP